MADQHEFESSQPAAAAVSLTPGERVEEAGTYLCETCLTPNAPRVHLRAGERAPLCQTCENDSRWKKISDASEFGR